jgi:signal transduction histidine kinase
MHMLSRPRRLPDGRVIWDGVQTDITNRKQAEQALIRSEKLASAGRMAATVAHEINNPLEAIGNAVYLAWMDKSISKDAKANLDIAVHELQRVAHLAQRTLGFYREYTIPAQIDLRSTVDSVVDLFTPRLNSRGIAIEKRYAEVETINAVDGEMRQIVSNLVSNSLDAMERNGRILLRIKAPANGRPSIRLIIADTGTGIAPERLPKIFEPFFTTKENVGTGLGLWVTKELVQKYGGTIRVRSKLGKGTVFAIGFPVRHQSGASGGCASAAGGGD